MSFLKQHPGITSPKFKQVILAVAIAIVLAFFVNYTLSVIYEEPMYNDFCPQEYKQYNDRSPCEAAGGKWSEPGEMSPTDMYADEYSRPMPKVAYPVGRECPGVCNYLLGKDLCSQANLSSCSLHEIVYEGECIQKGGAFIPAKECPTAQKPITGSCDPHYTCSKNFNSANDIYRRNIFITQVIIGGLLIVLGVALALPAVSGGIMSGAVITLFIALVGYWGDLNKWVRILVLGLILILLIWLGYKRLQK